MIFSYSCFYFLIIIILLYIPLSLISITKPSILLVERPRISILLEILTRLLFSSIEVLVSFLTSKPKIVIEKVTPETALMKMLKENGITKKKLVKNKSRFSKVLHNYYREANVQESFNVFLSKVIKRLD